MPGLPVLVFIQAPLWGRSLFQVHERFSDQLGRGGEREGRHIHPEICFCYGRGVGKCLLSFGEQMLIPLPCLPLILPNATRSTHGFAAVGFLRTSSNASGSSSVLAPLPAAVSPWMSLCPPCCCSWPVGCQGGSCSPTRSCPTAFEGHPSPPCAQTLCLMHTRTALGAPLEAHPAHPVTRLGHPVGSVPLQRCHHTRGVAPRGEGLAGDSSASPGSPMGQSRQVTPQRHLRVMGAAGDPLLTV